MADDVVHRVAIANTDTAFEVTEGERILSAAFRAGVWVPFECGWGSCGTCKMTLLQGQVHALYPEAPSISDRDHRRSRILACQSTPSSDLVIKPAWVEPGPRDGYATERCAAVLCDRDEIGPAIFRLRFTVDRAVSFHEGQHAIIDLGNGLRRCYSMSNNSGSTDVEFVMKRYPDGPGSQAISALTPGALIHIEMPYGDMWVRDTAAPLCLVAGGTGIAPILAMVRRLASACDGRAIRVFYGASSYAELVYWNDLSTLLATLPDADLHGALISPPAQWPGTQGLVTDALAAALPNLADADFHIAGPPIMTNAVMDLLKAAEIQLNRIHYDSFG